VTTKARNVRRFRGGEYVATLMAELERAAIAQRIANAREQAGLSQPELADLVHVHFRTIQDWESTKKQTTPWDRLDEIARVTGVTKEWLLHGSRREAEPPNSLLQDVADGVETLERAQVLSHRKLDEILARLARLEGTELPREETRPG